MTLTITDLSCTADAHLPRMVRASAKLEGTLGPDQVLWARLSSNGTTHQGQMKKVGRRYRLNPVSLPVDPVTLNVRVIVNGKPNTALVEAEQSFDLDRDTVI